MIIDDTTEELTPEQRIAFAGEVLLEKNSRGILTAPQSSIHVVRQMRPSEKIATGWEAHQTVIDNLPDILPAIGVPSNAPLPNNIPNPFDSIIP